MVERQFVFGVMTHNSLNSLMLNSEFLILHSNELDPHLLHSPEDRLLRGAGAQIESAANLVDRSALVVPQRERCALERTQPVESRGDSPLHLGAFRQPL